jgi:hypothetical protein
MSTTKQASVLNPTPDDPQVPNGEVCIPNISTPERRMRLRSGIFGFVFALVVLAILMVTGASHWWRLALFLPFAGAAVGFFQWQDKTCVGLSARQLRKLGDREEKIEDPAELAQVRQQARKVQLKALAAGLLLTLIVLVLP